MKKLIVLLTSIFTTLIAFSQITANTGPGNWSSIDTWIGGAVPTAGDQVIIPNGAFISIQSGVNAYAGDVEVQSGGSLTDEGTLTLIDLGPTDVFNSATGRVWMDRNLGASRVAISSDDSEAYGDLYQWGRSAEGHQLRTSGVYFNGPVGNPNTGNAWDGKFVLNENNPDDWLYPGIDDLWQGANGQNNPCPNGYLLPTSEEWDAERQSWSNNNAQGAFNSSLKLTTGGQRLHNTGDENQVGNRGFYWSSTVDGTSSIYLQIAPTSIATGVVSNVRGDGLSVRCIRY